MESAKSLSSIEASAPVSYETLSWKMAISTGAELRGRLCLITGATSGIGRATALALGAMGADLLLVGRSESGGRSVINAIQAANPAAQVKFIRADISSQTEVRALAQNVRQTHETLDVLINNAGVRFDSYGKTVDGLERTFATNHLGHFLLTCLLLDRLLRAANARIITVASGSHSSADAKGDWQFREDNYDRRMAYAKSKLANVLFAFELAARLKFTRATSNAVDPGGVASNFARNNGLLSWLRHLLAHALRRELVLPRRAAKAITFLASSRELTGVSGCYFCREQAVASAPAANSPGAARGLWALSLKLTGLNETVGPAWPLIHSD